MGCAIRNRIRELRAGHGEMTQQALADRIGKPRAVGYLCARHDKVARRTWDARTAVEATRSERYATDRAILAPTKRARLADVEAEIARREPSAPLDRAAYTGNVHPSITRTNHLSDSRIARGARLEREASQLRALIGTSEKEES